MNASCASAEDLSARAKLARLLEEAMACADTLGLPLVAAHVCEALDRLREPSAAKMD